MNLSCRRVAQICRLWAAIHPPQLSGHTYFLHQLDQVVEKLRSGKVRKKDFPTSLENPAKYARFPVSHPPLLQLLGYIFSVSMALLKVTFFKCRDGCER
jgi:hypothetical protein